MFRDPESKKAIVPDYVKIVRARTTEAFYELATARVWVDNFSKSFYLKLDPEQYYIQTWHGDRAFKKVGYDNAGVYNKMLEEYATLCVAGSDYGERQIRSAFRYKGEIMKVGYPRNDPQSRARWFRC